MFITAQILPTAKQPRSCLSLQLLPVVKETLPSLEMEGSYQPIPGRLLTQAEPVQQYNVQ